MGWGLISATIPCLKGFVVDLRTGYLGHNLGSTALAYGSNRYESSNREGYILGVLGGSHTAQSKTPQVQAANASNWSLTRPSQSNDHGILGETAIRRTLDYRVQYE